MESSEKKCRKNWKQCTDGFLFLIYLAMIILIIIWLFKLIRNTKDEPNNRERYVVKKPSNFYFEGEFCYDNYKKFISKGAFDTFGIRIKKIKRYSNALISTIFIGFGALLLVLPIALCIKKLINPSAEAMICIFVMFCIVFILSIILSLAFAIVLAHHYFKSKFNDFEEFSKCRYLAKKFKTDYDFIFEIKEEFNMPFVLILITEFINCIKLVVEQGDEDESEKKNVSEVKQILPSSYTLPYLPPIT